MFRRNFSLVSSTSSATFQRRVVPFFSSSRRFAGSSSTPAAGATSSNNATTASSSSASSSQIKPYSDEEIKNLVKSLEADPELAIRVVSNLSPAARRKLVVAGSAFEWFGGQRAAQSEVTAADYDHDKVISTKDFDTWFEKALQRRAASSDKKDGEKGDGAVSEGASSAGSVDVKKLGFAALAFIGLEAGLPFVGFGFLDNAAMILAGEDRKSTRLNSSHGYTSYSPFFF